MLAGIVGSELMTTIGLTNRYQLFTPEHMMLDDDLYHRAANAFRDLELDEETLALDVIDAVGPGGHFLGQPHTRRHMKETVERSIGQEIGPGRRAPARRRRGRARARRRHPGALRAGAAGRGEGGGAGEDLRRRGRRARRLSRSAAQPGRRRRQPGSAPDSPPDST